MGKLTKNRKEALAKFDKNATYALADAIKTVKEITFTKFDSAIDLDIRLGVDPRKANQMVRGSKTAESLPSAFIVFSDYLVSTIFTRPHVAYIILLLLLIYVVIQQIRTITQSGINYNNIILTRRLFLLYPITVILLSFTLIVVIFSFEHEYTFYTRYILFCLPLIMILTSFAIKKGLLLFDYILSNIYKRSIKRFYLKHSLLFSLLFAIVLFAPNSYKSNYANRQ